MSSVTSPKPPKYQELAELLSADIGAGILKPGDRLPTFEVLRARFQVTITTLDRAFIELEQNGLVRRERGRGVFVAEKKSRAKGVIGLIGFGNTAHLEAPATVSPRNFTGYFYSAHLMEGLDPVIREHDLSMMLLNHESDRGWDMVDGFLVCNLTVSGLEALRERLPQHLPCVSLLDAAENISTSMADDYNGARSAVQYLLGLGHRRIGYLLEKNSFLPQLRLAGYEHALQAAGIEPQPDWIIPPVDGGESRLNYIQLGQESVCQWLREGWERSRCTALFVQNDWVAIGALTALQEAGLRVPEDISVVGFDGTEACNLTTPKITAVEVPLEQIARSGMELLLRKIKTGDLLPHERVVIPTRLQIRESTGPAPEGV